MVENLCLFIKATIIVLTKHQKNVNWSMPFYSLVGDEEEILQNNKEDYLSVKAREKHLINLSNKYENVLPVFIDVSTCRLESGEEDWDAETPLVREVVGKRLDAVYSSEPSYEEYFKRAYPEAIHRIADEKRKNVPISGTMIREMNQEKERKKWIV